MQRSRKLWRAAEEICSSGNLCSGQWACTVERGLSLPLGIIAVLVDVICDLWSAWSATGKMGLMLLSVVANCDVQYTDELAH